MAASRRVSISKDLYGQLVDLIRSTADKLRRTELDYRTVGLRNRAIVNAMLDDAVTLGRSEHREMMATLLGRFVPSVLGERLTGEAVVVQPLIPGLELSDWFSVPPPNGAKHSEGWKKDRDVTPAELQRIIDHRFEIIQGHNVERNKFVLLRDTARELGCADDQPISTVFPEDRPDPPRPEDRPSA
jgi:hypothetical protein